MDADAEENFGGRQRKEGRIKFEELSIVKDVPRIQPLGKIQTMDAIHERARERPTAEGPPCNIDGVVGCLRNFIPIGLQPAWVEFAARRAQWSCVLNWLQGR